MKNLVLSTLLLGLFIATPALANTYYVATDGSDRAGDGSNGRPWATVQHGVDQAQPGDTILVREGRYREAIVFPNSGEPDARITVAAYEDEDVIMDGTKPVQDWQPAADDEPGLTVHGLTNRHWQNIHATRIHQDALPGDDRQWMLFEGGVHSRIARWPDQSVGFGTDTGELQPVPEEAYDEEQTLRDNAHFNPRNEDGFWHEYVSRLSEAQLASYFDDALAHIWIRTGGNFQIHREIVSHQGNAIQLDEIFRKGRPLRSGDRYSIVRHPHALDSPGEFYFTPEPDADGYHTFYLWPKDEASLDAGVTIPTLGRGFHAIAKQYITVDGFTVFGYTGEGIFFRKVAGSSEQHNNNGTVVRNCTVTDCGGTGIYLQAASEGVVEDCSVARVNGRGIFFTMGGEDVRIQRCDVTDSSSTCISFYSVRKGQMIDNRIHGARGVHANGSSVYLGAQDVLIARNIYYNGANATFQNIANVVFFANIIDAHDSANNRVATWPNSRNSDFPTQGYQVYINNTIIRSDNRHHLLSTRNSESDNYLFNNIIGGSTTMVGATRSHNGWVPLHVRWENADGSLNTRGEFDELEPGEWRIPRKDLPERRDAMFVDLDEEDYRLEPAFDNAAVHTGRDVQSFLEEMGIKETFPDFDFTVDLAGNPWNITPSLGAYEVVD